MVRVNIRGDSRFDGSRGTYALVVALMSAIVLAGFWPYYSGLLRGGTHAHWVVHVHAAAFSGWMVLLAFQVGLVLRRKVHLHRQLGRFGICLGVGLLMLGLVVTFVTTTQSVASGASSVDQAAGFLVLPVGDILLFAGFFGAGVYFRQRRELHRRLMMLASIALLFPAAARLAGDVSMAAVLAVWLLPLGVIILHEALTLRRVHRAYLAGAAVLLVAFARIALMENESWLVIGRWLLDLFPRA